MHIELEKDGGLCRSSGTAQNCNFGWKRQVVASFVTRLHIKLKYIYIHNTITTETDCDYTIHLILQASLLLRGPLSRFFHREITYSFQPCFYPFPLRESDYAVTSFFSLIYSLLKKYFFTSCVAIRTCR
jgi:hypothetical protein